jgi:asparagine synthase (glutamine-hydrolysing)
MTWLPDESLMNTDKMSMSVGQEVRVPFLDYDLVEYANALRSNKKINLFKQKIILRNRYKGVLPDYLFSQPKRGWISPGAKWLRDPVINAWAQEVFSVNYYDGISSAIDWEAARQLLKDHTDHKTYALNPLWNILTLQVWAKKNSVVYEC